ncbi:acetate--CoA ligase [Halobacteriales archaeon SW_5_70_135]|nr:MAG: acetate--CoA ligase [Halobacteriales archaeon SW_5_70_135]
MARDIEARLDDREYVRPPVEFVGQANCTDRSVHDRFEEEWPDAYETYADLLDWDRRWETVLDDSDPPFYEWFVGGRLNASRNCVDRHLDDRGDQAALVWEGEDGSRRTVTYRDLYRRVNATAAALRDLGVDRDDVVTVHLPMVPALPVTMLACARIGAVHSVVFAGFSASALADRLDDADSDVLVTVDGYYRRGEFLDHKAKVDAAVAEAGTDVRDVVVFERHGSAVHEPGAAPADANADADAKERVDPDDLTERDVLAADLLAERERREVDPVSRDAEDPLFLMYTSGTTGQPKGCQHRTGGYLAYAAATTKYVLDVTPADTYWCAADIGWITGHSYIVYGPLALGTTSVMYEGAPDHPHRGRVWEIAERHDVDVFHTSPTAVRQFMKWGEQHLAEYDFDVRHLTTVGEPIQPEAWRWYHEHVGGGDAVVVDTWWQTETGGHLITNLPALDDMKPGSAGRPCPGIGAAVYDDDGDPVPERSDRAGNLVIERPWPGMLQTVYGDDERFVEEYWRRFSDLDSDDPADWVYETGDGAVHESDGYFRVLGRLDDVMNVAGHRLGTMELESAVCEADGVAEAAVVARQDDQKGEAPDAYVTLRDGVDPSESVRKGVVAAVESAIGPFARPANVYFVDELPKTRSGKIMRRLLADVSNGAELGNTTTLHDPSVPERIREQVGD